MHSRYLKNDFLVDNFFLLYFLYTYYDKMLIWTPLIKIKSAIC